MAERKEGYIRRVRRERREKMLQWVWWRGTERNPQAAASIGFVTLGVGGHFYNGEVGRTIFFALAQAISMALITFLIGIPFFLFFWFYGVINARKRAVEINKALQVVEGEE